MTFAEAVDYLELQGRLDGLPHEATDWLLLLHKALEDVSARTDLDAFTQHSDTLFVTVAELELYALPDDFARLMRPRHDRKTGIRLYNGTTEAADLEYLEPQPWQERRTTTTGTPSAFTILGRDLALQPIPDSNAGTNYTGRGIYIATIPRPSMADSIPLPDAAPLVDYVFGLAAKNTSAQAMAMSVIVNNQAKAKQRFWRSRERWLQR